MNTVGNIEQFFHRVTDIYQHHKKLISDLKDKNKTMTNDIRVLNAKELTLASNLRSLTDSFRLAAIRYQKQRHSAQIKQKQYHQLLQRLRQDKSIVITRPDKGRGVVIMNKNDYLLKMHAILNDSSKFKCLFVDPTITREKSLANLLRRLKNQGHISEQFYYMARPSGSNPGRLYGLPKIHKDDVPLRPVLSAIGTYNYGLGKALKQILSNIVKNKRIIKDSFTFVDALQSLKNHELNEQQNLEYKMVSFDIASLYTNIPLDETIQIVLNHLYDTENPATTMKREDMKKLLEFATKDSHFLFDGKIYDQIDGVSMGSPLAPLLAEIFLQDFEEKHLHSFKEKGIIYWRRYVDDTFVLLDAKVSPDYICDELSKCHSSIKFTCGKDNVEDSVTKSLAFLDVLIRKEVGMKFQTTIYRKPTYSGLMTKWDSFVPKSYKRSAISSMVYRAIRICSSHQEMHDQFDFIRKISSQNGYPNAFVESIIRKQLLSLYSPREPQQKSLETQTVVLRVPYHGTPSQIFAKRVTATVAKQYPTTKVRVVYDVKARIGQNFTTKDRVSKQFKSGVVYEAACPDCDAKYIGKTYRHLTTRMNEHLAEQKKLITAMVSN